MKYHVNMETGETGECSAKQKCPFGGDLITEHYSNEAEARAAYEKAMEGELFPSNQPVKKTLWEKLKGASDEEVLQRDAVERAVARAKAAAEKEAKLTSIIYDRLIELRDEPQVFARFSGAGYKPRKSFMGLLKAAKDYKSYREESLYLLEHWDALEVKKKKLQQVAKKLVEENPYAFKDVSGTGKFLIETPNYGLRAPGEDKALFDRLVPTCKQIMDAHGAADKEQEELVAEANKLRKTIFAESELDADARAQLSARTRELLNGALNYSSPDIRSKEEVEDRQAWFSARDSALEEIKARNS